MAASRRRLQFGLGTMFLLMLLSTGIFHPESRRQFVRWGWLPNTRRLINPVFEFEGKRFAGLLTESGERPRNIPKDVVPAYLLVERPFWFLPTLWIVQLDSAGNAVGVMELGEEVAAVDLTGNGIPELVVAEKLPHGHRLIPALRNEYADGTRDPFVYSPAHPRRDPLVRVYSLVPRFELQYEFRMGRLGSMESTSNPDGSVTTTHVGYDYCWADVFGTGRPVFCEVEITQRATDSMETRQDALVRYRRPDQAGRWLEHSCRVPLTPGDEDDLAERLAGVLQGRR